MLFRTCLCVVALVVFFTGVNADAKPIIPPSGSSCERLSTCHSECVAGNQSSCVRESAIYLNGVGIPVDKAKGAQILKNSCDAFQHSRACMEYGWLAQDGWMFDIERNAEAFRKYAVSLARSYALADCQKGEMDACFVSAELEVHLLDVDGQRNIDDKKNASEAARIKRVLTAAMSEARKACKAGHGDACQWILDNAFYVAVLEDSKTEDGKRKLTEDVLAKEARAGFENACTKGDHNACNVVGLKLLKDNSLGTSAKKFLTRPCKEDNAASCFIIGIIDFLAVASRNSQPSKANLDELKKTLPALIDQLMTYCHRAKGEVGTSYCNEVAELYVEGDEPEMGFDKPNPQRALEMFSERCKNGMVDSCKEVLDLALNNRDMKLQPTLVLEANHKLCSLAPYDEQCNLCSPDPKHKGMTAPKGAMCRKRLAWKERLDCDEGKEDRCEVLASMYEKGDGVRRSINRSIDYYRVACDSALKSSCSTLENLCQTEKGLIEDERCKQSLIHTDVFYEAEWQFRQTGSAKILGESVAAAHEVAKVSLAGTMSNGAGLSLKRGSLDAELVVSIVLDRARQAAIRLVVNELKKAGQRAAVPIYLEDLMIQASLLLSDESSMRREKFQDLAMTVVRAFVASNLTKTLYETNEAILNDPLWKQWAAEAKLTWQPKKFKEEEIAKLRGYLTDWAYLGLTSTKLFSRAGDRIRIPSCPFRNKASMVTCKLLDSGNGKPNVGRLTSMLKIDAMLQGLSLAKALREEGSIDLRRFIEAIGRSQTIANLKSTPGLNLEQWKKEIANVTETKLRDMRVQIDAAQTAFSVGGWRRVSSSSQIRIMRTRALGLVGKNSPYLALLSPENVQAARGILKLAVGIEEHFVAVEKIEAKLAAKGGLSFGGSSVDTSWLEAELSAAKQARSVKGKALAKAIEGWEDVATLLSKIDNLRSELDKTRPLMLEFRRSVVEIETVLRRYKPPRLAGADVTVDVESKFEISHVPLHALPDLRNHFTTVATTLVTIDKQLGQVFPGGARPKLKFAVSAVVRLLGFFDLMERVARTARLNQTCGDVMEALRLLGSVRDNEFSAPLFDVMDPILHAIKTHEPMDVDQLFTIISEVRLDSLLTSLADNAEKPCKRDESGYECWTFKIIHSLQEAVQRDGNTVRIDGGAFAKRLASHGDDFRRRHKWRSYFHLTVGLGGLLSDSPVEGGSGSDSRRVVPIVGEQIGFGWASPTLWDDSLTFKFGVYGSGILYRAALDSAESNAIMASPFIALDIYDIVEFYAGPMVLFYPPTDTEDTAVRFGVAAGITVPLSAYWEKL